MRWGALLLAGLVGTTLGCVLSFDYGGTRFRCEGADMLCPDGQMCIDGFCESGSADGGMPDGPSADAAPLDPAALVGNLVHLTFDDNPPVVVQNRARAPRQDSAGVGLNLTPGRFGDGVTFDGLVANLFLPDHPDWFSDNTITIEAWINLTTVGVRNPIYADADNVVIPAPEYLFEVTANNTLALTTADGCGGGIATAESVNSTLTAATWTHVAVSWNGTTADFYVDGSRTDSVPFGHTSCETPTERRFFIGRADPDVFFTGSLDEIKVSDYAKSAAEIAASMTYDPSALVEVCGDSIVEGAETCEGDLLCCEASTCRAKPDDTACGAGTCAAGVCNVPGGRVTAGLIALYEFNEGVGDTVGDTSGVGVPLDLSIQDPMAISWNAGSLTVDAPTRIGSIVAADKVIAAITASNEITVEAWVASADVTQTGPGRVVTLSIDAGLRNFTLGQRGPTWVTRIRSLNTDSNGFPAANSAIGDVREQLSHVVATRDSGGLRTVYVDGVPRSQTLIVGGFSNWNTTYPLTLANEPPGTERPWLGRLHLIAVYSTALSPEQVARNYTAGAD